MRKRAPTRVVVEDSQPQAQHIRALRAPAVDGRATTAAERAEDARRGFEFTEPIFAGEEPPVLASDVGIGSEGRPAGLSAARAVAVDDGADLARHLDPDPTAQAIGVHASWNLARLAPVKPAREN